MNTDDRQHQQLRQISTAALIEESGHMRYLFYTVIAIAVFVCIFLTWSAFTTIKETAKTFGYLVPESHVQIIQHLEGGIIKSIKVKNGQRVKKGQTLMVLDQTTKAAELAQLRGREVVLVLNMARLHAFLDDKPADVVQWANEVVDSKYNTVKNSKQIARLLKDERRHLAAQHAQRRHKISVLKNIISQRYEKMKEAENQLKVWDKHIELLTQEFEMYRKLQAKDLVARKDYLVVLREMNRAKGERVRLTSQIEQTRQGIQEAKNKLKETNAKYLEEAEKELGTNNDELLEVRHKIEKISDQLTRMTIVAPVAGVVKGLSLLPGNVAKSGAELLQIVPTDKPLIVESRINPRDIGHIKIGDHVKVKILTYDYARYGGIEGRLSKISATTFEAEDGKPYYKATIQLDKQFLGQQAQQGKLLPGMTVEADIITGDKTLLSYLLKPVQNTANRAFRER